MNILVTGANGQLGNEMRLVARHSADKYIFTDISQAEGQETVYLDITDPEAVHRMVREYKIDAIVNCAAWTNVDACETDVTLAALAARLNADAPGILAATMKETGGWLVHISTDYVFGTEPYNTPCAPDRTGTPTGVYGRTKLQGEQNIIAAGCRHIIIRTAWLYSEFGKNFCKTMLSLTATRPAIKVVFDQCGTTTYALDLAQAIFQILEVVKSHDSGSADTLTGIYHYSNEGVASWYDFAQMTAHIAGHTRCDIQPCYSREYPSPVHRPAYSVLDKKSIRETFSLSIPYWVDSLQKCITNIQDSKR